MHFFVQNPNLAQSLKNCVRPYGRMVAAFRNSVSVDGGKVMVVMVMAAVRVKVVIRSY